MQPVSYARHQFPPEIIRYAVWLYLRFTLSYRDVEELLAERGISVAYESVRRWVIKFSPVFARNLRRLRPRPSGTWHLDEMVVSIQGRRMYLWRAVDAEGKVLDVPVQPKRDKRAAQKLMRKLLKKQGMAPDVWVTDKCPGLRSGASRAAPEQGSSSPAQARQQPGGKLARPGETTRTEAARLQVARISPAVLVDARGHLQHLHRSPSPRLSSHASALPSRGVRNVAQCGRPGFVRRSGTHFIAATRANVTSPSRTSLPLPSVGFHPTVVPPCSARRAVYRA
jgi:transposase-like protein